MAGGERVCAILPAFNEERRVGEVVREVRALGVDVAVVDDGSTDGTAQAAREAGAVVLEHIRNRGKGMALFTGFEWAREEGYDLALTMDADGQHAPEDIPAFLAARRRAGAAVLVGNRMERAGGMPWTRRLTNRWMSRSLSKLMRQWVPDTQCGFRLYHRSAFPVEAPAKGERRFAAESAELLRLALEGVRIGAVPVQTIYADERSKIRPLRDAARYWWMLRRFKRAKRKHERMAEKQ